MQRGGRGEPRGEGAAAVWGGRGWQERALQKGEGSGSEGEAGAMLEEEKASRWRRGGEIGGVARVLRWPLLYRLFEPLVLSRV